MSENFSGWQGLMAMACLGLIVLLALLTSVGSAQSSGCGSGTIALEGGSLTWGGSLADSGPCGPGGDTYKEYQFWGFAFNGQPLQGTDYWYQDSGCVPGFPSGADPESITMTGPGYEITFYPSGPVSGCAVYKSTS